MTNPLDLLSQRDRRRLDSLARESRRADIAAIAAAMIEDWILRRIAPVPGLEVASATHIVARAAQLERRRR